MTNSHRDPHANPPPPAQQLPQPPHHPPGHNPPAFNVPPATLALAGAMVAVFALLHLLPESVVEAIAWQFSFNAELLLRALDGHGPLGGAALRLVSHMFLHYDALHLAVNVGFMLAFASVVERRLGKLAFLALFLASGIAGALFETWFFTDPATLHIPMVGASGGIMGLMATALMITMAPAHRSAGNRTTAGAGRPALLRVMTALVGLNVVIGLMSEAGLTGPYLIGWRAHLGGFALGLVVGWVLRRRQRG